MNLRQHNELTLAVKTPTSFHKSLGVACISSAVLLGSVTTPVAADVAKHAPLIKAYSDETVFQYVANNADFRANHPLKLFIQTGQRGERRDRAGKRRNHSQRNILRQHQIVEMLPSYIVTVPSAREADLVIRVRQTDYNMNFRVIDVDQKDKKYKKDRRYLRGRCGVHHKAYYTKVKEKGEAYASYKVAVRLNGISQDRDHFTLRAAKNFSYGKNLRAATNCGLQPTQHMPSNKVAKLFSKADLGYRHYIADQIKGKTATDLSRQVAGRILVQADNFYTNLAVRLSHYNKYEEEDRLHSRGHNLLQLSSLLWRFAEYREQTRYGRRANFGH